MFTGPEGHRYCACDDQQRTVHLDVSDIQQGREKLDGSSRDRKDARQDILTMRDVKQLEGKSCQRNAKGASRCASPQGGKAAGREMTHGCSQPFRVI